MEDTGREEGARGSCRSIDRGSRPTIFSPGRSCSIHSLTFFSHLGAIRTRGTRGLRQRPQ